MGAFAVLLHEDEPEASKALRSRIKEVFPDSEHYEFSEYVYLVSGPRLTTEVKEKLGLDDDENLYAAILRLKRIIRRKVLGGYVGLAESRRGG